MFFGRIVASKGVADALVALGKLKSKGVTDWNFRMLGTGNHGWAQKLAENQGVGDHIRIFPAVGDEDLHRELASADLAFMPSHAEAFGLSVAEAQAVTNGYLTDASISGATVTVSPTSLDLLAHSDPVTVTVAVPYASVSWLPVPIYFKEWKLSQQTVMRAERAH